MALRLSMPPEPEGVPAGWLLMQPGETEAVPPGPEWLHEIKHDGWRISVRTDGKGGLRLASRGSHDRTWQFKRPVEKLAVCGAACIIDGEVAVPDDKGVTNIRDLHHAMSDGHPELLAYYAFDLLWLDGADLREWPIEMRKQRLRELIGTLDGCPRVQYVEHCIGIGPQIIGHVAKLGAEGLVSKRLGSSYVGSAKPADSWIKTKVR